MDYLTPDIAAEDEDWIARLLQQGPCELRLDALQTDIFNIMPPGQSSSDHTDNRSDESSQSQVQLLGSAAALQDLALPELDDLLQDPFWQDLAVSSCPPGAACEPGCSCLLPPQPGRRQGRKVARNQPRPADQLLSSWTNVSSSPASSDGSAPDRDTQQDAQGISQAQVQQPAEYPSSSHDSCHRPQSPAEALRDTSCTPQAPLPQPPRVDHSQQQCLPHAQVTSQTIAPFQPSTPLPAFQFTEGRQQVAPDESKLDPEEAKKAARMQRNRESAHYSRQRKKMQSSELEKRCQDLQTHNTHLTGLVNQLTAEVGMLRHQLVMASTQAGASALHAASGAPMQAAAAAPNNFGYAPFAMPMALTPPQQLPTPKVPIQKLPPSRPAPAKKTKAPALQPAAAQTTAAGAARPSKRARTVASVTAGATAMLALCCVLAISSPGLPASSQGGGGSSSLGQVALPAIRGPGRALQSDAPILPSDSRTAAALGLAPGVNTTEWNHTEWNGDAPPWWHAANGSAWEPVTLRPADRGAEALALQHLKDLAPVAVLSDWAQQAQARSLASTPQFHSFPQLAGSVLGSSGLPSPAACREVFSFDATSLVDVGAAQASLKRHLANLGTFRGRTLGALPLPPIGGLLPSSSQEEEVLGKRPKQTIGCGDDSEVVVSLMLPSRQTPEEDAPSLNSLDQIFVVVLKPGKQYTTYSCGLDKPVFA